MPQVKNKVTINAPFETVWQLAQDVEKFPSIMPDLEKVEVLERSEPSPQTTRTVTEWNSRIKQFNRSIVWTEEDIWNRERGTCDFWQLKGDFTEYKGSWKFREVGQTTELDLSIDYAFEIPLVGALMKGVLQKLMQQNVDMMSLALKTESEKRV
ncbi:MAG TPA: SRPBCC family protein [Abditibacterium sp.]|jgi:ribosome-associated toxin RatA of RatAB toxin-antitoxin module